MIQNAKQIIPFSTVSITEGFKYLGFFLKPNCYSFEYWVWLYKKVEARISAWTNIFLSRGGRLVLLKVVLQSILVYWESISYIPKGILTKIRKKCFSFPRKANRQTKGIPLMKWSALTLPKELGGRGIKNHALFCKALAAKSLWRLAQSPYTMWGRVTSSK